MLEKLRQRSAEEEGFTLVELLVVMLILGILAAIAIPSFFAQRDKATDAEAKSMAKTAQTAIETYATDNGGSYASATPTILNNIEETVQITGVPAITVPAAGPETYTVTASADTGNTFSVSRLATGATNLTCTVPGGETVPFGGCGIGNKW